ncbi:hypothetical protein [Candidatus Nitrosocosmicus sp. SS]|jgi:hypothetical protein|uniref:hypothetical protein n=1 Tax=Candidatus Nitrosocosmicus agrestis TaxID=2563600 RepID=UPI00122E41FB|nr:hypothetical protein [Candidatus Nitrosocosmicus sp. SS]KAA2283373.1 hypothetical protein F1Z66_02445 [Candidatus Nitrosocosmicus sp. SS]KAF0868981.1 hypothetical protein E5N71_08285 [Candidatus Nitrosocosmicus sp. SS]
MSELDNIIVSDSGKSFRLRINGYLRSRGISQITGTKTYLEIDFIRGEISVRIPYPRKIEELPNAIEKALLLETELSPKQIDNIKFYVKDYVDKIEEAIGESKNLR